MSCTFHGVLLLVHVVFCFKVAQARPRVRITEFFIYFIFCPQLSIKEILASAGVGGAVTLAGSKIAVVSSLNLLGFTSKGILAGSYAAKWMAATAIANGGGVPSMASGGLVAILQHFGAGAIPAYIFGSAALGGVGGGIIFFWYNKDTVYWLCRQSAPYVEGGVEKGSHYARTAYGYCYSASAAAVNVVAEAPTGVYNYVRRLFKGKD